MSRKSPVTWIQRCLALFGIMHFLFGTDVVAYRYGRGYHNRHETFFHWTEKWSWRIAILLPIYQNCTNGHWENGHKRFPILGKVLKWVAAVWAVWFFVFQVINSDVMLTYQFFRGLPKEILIKKLGLYNAPFFRRMHYPYRFSLVTMWMTYGILPLVGFTPFHIFLQSNDKSSMNDMAGDNCDKESDGLLDALDASFESDTSDSTASTTESFESLNHRGVSQKISTAFHDSVLL